MKGHKQRVSFTDAMIMLEKQIKIDRDKHFPSITYEEDAYGGSREYIRNDIVEQMIKKLTR